MSDLDEIRRCSVAIYAATEKGPADDISRILRGAADEIEQLRKELAMWRPLTREEAEKAFEEAEAMPISEERIAEIVAKATDPAEWVENSHQMQMAAKIKRDAPKLALWEEMRAALHITSNMSPISGELEEMPNDLELSLGYVAEDLKEIRAVLDKCKAIDPPKTIQDAEIKTLPVGMHPIHAPGKP